MCDFILNAWDKMCVLKLWSYFLRYRRKREKSHHYCRILPLPESWYNHETGIELWSIDGNLIRFGRYVVTIDERKDKFNKIQTDSFTDKYTV